ncbi:uncharacterized protein LOC116616891 [Nematostella vectensis]|uniref:uncharacterized protein LOC116616891 n=1 Tax=Nematostella vectensis TaxID=45351 RepID=UPI00138FEDF1|nr:uncharacterized protein LOC116616891 [Nematostella vectensis]
MATRVPAGKKVQNLTVVDAVPWPCVAGPPVVEKDPRLWKAPKLDMNTSLAFLRRELAAMQLQDRALHKQLLALHSGICNMKADLKELWENEIHHQTETSTSRVQHVSSHVNTDPEAPRTQVVHAKEDSGILTDEERDDESKDKDKTDGSAVTVLRAKSVSMQNLTNSKSDFNNNFRRKKITDFYGFHLSKPRERSMTYSEGVTSLTNRFTSMPVINELPADEKRNIKNGKAFAVYGYKKGISDKRMENSGKTKDNLKVVQINNGKRLPVVFGKLVRHESMPVMAEDRSANHRRANSARSRLVSSVKVRDEREKPVLSRARSQLDLRPKDWDEPDYRHMTPYTIYRSASQISLV